MSKKIPGIIVPLLEIRNELGFVQVQKYYINGDGTKIGLAYVFNIDHSTKSTQYLLYTQDTTDKNEFIHYEQFMEYRRDLVEFNAHWTYCCIDNTAAD